MIFGKFRPFRLSSGSFFRRTVTLVALAVLGVAGGGKAAKIKWDDSGIIVKNAYSDLSPTKSPWWNDGGNYREQARITRMGMAVFRGVAYYAICSQSGGIHVVPTKSGDINDLPNVDESFFIGSPDGQRLLVGGLVEKDGLLYLVYFPDDGSAFYVQRLKAQAVGNALAAAGDVLKLGGPSDRTPFTSVVPAVGTDGVYIHVVATSRPYNVTSLLAYVVRGDAIDFVKGAIPFAGDQPTYERMCADAVVTHEADGDGNVVEAHYLVWRDHHAIRMARFLPDVGYGGFKSFLHDIDPGYGNVVALLDTGLKTDFSTPATPNYLSLVQFYRRGDGYVSAGAYKLPIGDEPINDPNIAIILPDFPYGDTPQFRNGVLNVGVDKNYVRSDNDTSSRKGKGDAGFADAMRICPRIACIRRPFGDNIYRWEMIHGQLRGNLITSPPGDSVKRVDTSIALGDSKAKTMATAWTLLGVMHGVPPYVPYKEGGAFPTVTYNVSNTETKTASMTFTSETSYELSIGFTGGTLPKDAFGCSLDFSYSSGVKSTESKTSSSTETISQSGNYTNVPTGYAKLYDPSRIGTLLFSAPTLTSKTYLLKRWDGTSFSGPTRYLFFTKVTGRTLQFLHYLIDDPDLGPIESMNTPGSPTTENPLKDLTAGMAKVERTSDLKSWRKGAESDIADSNVYDQFGPPGGGSVNLPESKGTDINITLSYGESSKTSETTARVRTDKETVKSSFGVKDIFVFNTSGTFTQADGYSNTQERTLAVTNAVSVRVPPLPGNQDVEAITVTPLLVFGKAKGRTPSWLPTIFKGRDTPFLLTWKVTNVLPREFGRKPWKIPGYHKAYPAE